MILHKAEITAMLGGAARLWRENTTLLGEIDARFGDGDHGVTIGKMAALMEERLESWRDQSIKVFLEDLSAGFLGINGGSAGPLYGTLLEGLAAPMEDSAAGIDGELLKAMLAGSRDALFDITTARVGDKTMMDALIPAAEAAQKAQGGPGAVLRAAAGAARDGAQATKAMVSKFGRARSYGEKTLGTRDAGAVSTALFFAGLEQGYLKGKEEGAP